VCEIPSSLLSSGFFVSIRLLYFGCQSLIRSLIFYINLPAVNHRKIDSGLEDKYLIGELNNKNKVVFDFVFNYYYSGLCAFVFQIVADRAVAEDLVQDFFFKIWVSKTDLEISTSLKSYFFTSVKNMALNHLKHLKVKEEYGQYIKEESERENKTIGWEFAESELAELIDEAIQKLAPRCRDIFVASRFEGKDNASIAVDLGISKRTVELQISNALKQLRTELKDYLPLALLLYLIK